MSDDSLSAVWMSDQPIEKEAVVTAVNAVLREDRDVRDKERWVRTAATLALALLCPVLLWCAAHGLTPLVRGGYALMAAGAALFVFAEWVYFGWSRQALPGPADARSQLHRTAFLLARQATLSRTAPVWCAPIFIGTGMIALWMYQARSHAGGFVLAVIVLAGWVLSAVGGMFKGTELDARRARVERLLSDLA